MAAKIGGTAYTFPLDVTDRAAVDALAASASAPAHGPIDVLVNNAGIIRRGKVDDADAPRRLGRHASRSTWTACSTSPPPSWPS